jgi:hypothetical protein
VNRRLLLSQWNKVLDSGGSTMRKLLVLSVLLLGTVWVAAQTDPSQSSPSPSASSSTSSQTSSNPSSQASSASSTGQTTVEGCLSGSNGNFTLTDKSGTSYQLSGDTAQLSDHVGHDVQITGSTQNSSASASSPSSNSGANAASSGQSGASAQQTLSVSSMKHISSTCSTSSGSTSPR